MRNFQKSGKIFTLLIVMLSVVFIIVGCGNNESVNGTSTSNNSNDKSDNNQENTQFPEKALTLIVPFSAGGGADSIARTIADIAEKNLGQPITVVNRGGAGGTLGATEALEAEADGYTLLFATSAVFSSVPHLQDVSFSIDDFVGVSALTKEPTVMVVNSNSEWETLEDLIAEKDNDNTIIHGDGGVGTVANVALEAFFNETGIKTNYIPYEGFGPAKADLLGGHIEVSAALPAGVLSNVEAGDFKVLGVFSKERNAYFPDTPTFAEKGYDIDIGVQRFISAPKDTPEEVLKVLREAFDEAKKSDEFKEFAEKVKMEINPISGEEINGMLEEQYDLFEGKLKEFGLLEN